jgi:hypothetical protein|tara:strand:- start:235 stop:519 length:285 start_codon:yes stop_codon:yes gene_type:complete
MNWFLYLVTSNFLDVDGELIKRGNAGVGRCSMSPGIIDAPYGTMYVVSEQDVKNYFNKHRLKSLRPYNIRRAIEAFYSFKEVEEIEEDDEFVFD